MGNGCQHQQLRFGSGGYYIFCVECPACWCAGEERPGPGNREHAETVFENELRYAQGELEAEVERLRDEVGERVPLDMHEAVCDEAMQMEREACALRLEQEAREAIEEEHGTPAHAEGLLEAARLIRARGEGGEE